MDKELHKVCEEHSNNAIEEEVTDDPVIFKLNKDNLLQLFIFICLAALLLFVGYYLGYQKAYSIAVEEALEFYGDTCLIFK